MQITRESIFVGTIRSFCTGFAVVLGVLLAIGLGLLLLSSFNATSLLPPKAEMTLLPDAEGSRAVQPLSSPVLLKIDIHGVIGEPRLAAADIENILISSREDLLSHDRVKGILLHIDTPGGTASDSATIHRMLLDYKQKYHVPIYAYVDGLCASGGMYIASACDKIFATPWSVVGSVGVIMPPAFNISTVMEKWGIQSLTLSAGKDKDLLNPFRPWSSDEAGPLKPLLAALYEQFVKVVVEGRPKLNREKLLDDYGAKVFIAQTAMDHGYIDSFVNSYEDSIRALAEASGIEKHQAYQVVQLAPPYSIFFDLFKTRSSLFQGKLTHRIQLHPSLPDELCTQPLYLYFPSQ